MPLTTNHIRDVRGGHFSYVIYDEELVVLSCIESKAKLIPCDVVEIGDNFFNIENVGCIMERTTENDGNND